MLAAKLNKPPLHDLVPIRDGAYGIPWRVRNLDLSGVELPTQEYAEYLINTVYFYFDSLYYLFDKAAVLTRLADFYSTDIDYIEHYTQLWHLQLIVIFAIGKSILARGAEKSGPVGALLFSRAVEAFPDNHRFYQDPTLSIEILILFALFMQAMDLRLAAQQYVRLVLHSSPFGFSELTMIHRYVKRQESATPMATTENSSLLYIPMQSLNTDHNFGGPST